MTHVRRQLEGSALAEAVVPLALQLAPTKVTFLRVVGDARPLPHFVVR